MYRKFFYNNTTTRCIMVIIMHEITENPLFKEKS